MAQFLEPCPCPDCGEAAPRQLASAQLAFGARPTPAVKPKAGGKHRAGCGCCTPVARGGLKAEAATLGAPRRAKATSSSFLDRS